jgi:Flp pilus assembly protein CpaB
MLKSYRARSIALAVGLAAVAAILVGLYIQNYRNDVNSGADLVSVLVAARDIPQDTLGSSLSGGGYLKREQILRRSLVAGAIVDPQAVSGLVVGATIYSGQQITVRQFRPLVQQGVLGQISDTQRALVVPGDTNQLLQGIVNAGDHVDVVANIKYTVHQTNSTNNDLNRVASRIILRNLLVLKAPPAPKGGIGSQQQTSILLRLTDAQVQKMFFAMKNGDWSLALRPVDHPSDSPESVETIESILSDGLKLPQLFQLTGGLPKGSINGQ